MALAATTIHEVMSTGSDTLNGGMFDPGQTAGMFTDGAATVATSAAPVFTSASYNFVAGDVGAWVFIASGTNWTPGWWKIASVGSNAATLNATIGSAVVSVGIAGASIALGLKPSVVTGCATTASPTGATWAIDYSQQAAAQFAYTDLASVGAGLLVASAAKPFAAQQVGNSIVITGGTNFTAGRYVIASVSAGVATVVGAANITTGAGVNGTGGQGGAFASYGQSGAHIVASNQMFVKTATYTITSASTNIAAGCFTASVRTLIEGYATVRGDLQQPGASGTRPTAVASGISTFTLITQASAGSVLRAFILDGASLTSSKGHSATNSLADYVSGANFTNGFLSSTTQSYRCVATGCATIAPFGNTSVKSACVAYSNTVSGFVAANCVRCVSYNNSGASSDGFESNTAVGFYINCVAYGNGRNGYTPTAASNVFLNCIAESNTGYGYVPGSAGTMFFLCAAYLNTSGRTSITGPYNSDISPINGSASFFTNAAGADFSLNNTANAGALLRAAGYPGVLPIGGTGYLDVGALQHLESPIGGGSVYGGLGGVIT